MSLLLSKLRFPLHSRLLLRNCQHLWDKPRNTSGLQAASDPIPVTNYVGAKIIQGAKHNDDPFPSDQAEQQDEATSRTLDLGDFSRLDHKLDPFGVEELVTLEDLLKARVHFGHKAGMWDTRMKPYIYGIRNKTHIINLDTTLVNLKQVLNVLGHMAYRHGIILFVNERKQYEELTEQLARSCQEYFVTSWIPGTLSNSYKLLKTFIVPDLIVFTSLTRSVVAVREAVSMGIPSVGVVDTNCNPDSVLYPIPGNDDSPQAILLYYELFLEVIKRGKQLRLEDDAAEAEIERRRKMERHDGHSSFLHISR